MQLFLRIRLLLAVTLLLFTVNYSDAATIKGKISFAYNGLAGVSISGGAALGTASSDPQGSYEFQNVSSGTYILSPSLNGYVFEPQQLRVTVHNSDVTVRSFKAQKAYSIFGRISLNGTGLAGITVKASRLSSVTTDSEGNFSFTAVPAGSYEIAPDSLNEVFTPSSRLVRVSAGDVAGVEFRAVKAYSISGKITKSNGQPMQRVRVALAGLGVVRTNASGAFTFSRVPDGSYLLTPKYSGLLFSPSEQTVVVNGAPLENINFTGYRKSKLSGYVTFNGAPLSNVSVQLSGVGSALTNRKGYYRFRNLLPGTYSLSPTLAWYVFAPETVSLNMNEEDLRQDFNATLTAGSITGRVTYNGKSLASVSIFAGDIGVSTNNKGEYAFAGLADGGYTISASLRSFIFSPEKTTLTIARNIVTVDFLASDNPAYTSCKRQWLGKSKDSLAQGLEDIQDMSLSISELLEETGEKLLEKPSKRRAAEKALALASSTSREVEALVFEALAQVNTLPEISVKCPRDKQCQAVSINSTLNAIRADAAGIGKKSFAASKYLKSITKNSSIRLSASTASNRLRMKISRMKRFISGFPSASALCN